VAVAIGCLPIVVGDSSRRAFERHRREGKDFFLLRTWQMGDPGGRITTQLPRERLARVAPPAHPRDPRAVALLGSGSGAENDDLFGLLAALGLRPTGAVLPDVGLDLFERVADAAVFVWTNRWSLVDERLMDLSGVPVTVVRPGPPVGLAGTRAWLEGVVAATPVDPTRLDEVLADAVPAEELADVRARAGRFAMLFVADATESRLLIGSNRDRGLGFSPLAVLHEMGFRTRLLGYGATAAFAPVVAELAAMPGEQRTELRVFQDPGELSGLLGEPDVGAVYSSFNADPRVLGAGRCVFCEHDFELGLRGFLRTARRLLDMCERRPLKGLEAFLGGTT
jgi:hypothetical protein